MPTTGPTVLLVGNETTGLSAAEAADDRADRSSGAWGSTHSPVKVVLWKRKAAAKARHRLSREESAAAAAPAARAKRDGCG
jgi:hypothetical protein